VYGHLDADKDSHPEGDPYDGKKGPSFIVSKMAKRDFFEKVWENHKLKLQMSKFLPAVGKYQMDFRVQNEILKRVQNDIPVW
jgi:hypothetical protein